MKKLLIIALLSASTFTGCNSISGIGANVTNTNGNLGGGVTITFKDSNGVLRYVPVSRTARSRGYSADGTRFVSLGELKTYAIAIFHDAGRPPAGFNQLNAFDSQTIALLVGTLAQYGAQPNTIQ